MEKFKDRLEAVMGKLGITQYRIAADTGIRQSTVSKALSGKVKDSPSLVDALSEVYNVNREYMQGKGGAMFYTTFEDVKNGVTHKVYEPATEYKAEIKRATPLKEIASNAELRLMVLGLASEIKALQQQVEALQDIISDIKINAAKESNKVNRKEKA